MTGLIPYILSIAAAETDWGFATLSCPAVSALAALHMWVSACPPAYIQSKEEEWDLVCLPFLDPAGLALLVGEITSSACSLVWSASMLQFQKAPEGFRKGGGAEGGVEGQKRGGQEGGRGQKGG